MGYFIYCRKSTEAEDRQVLSIESQVQELTRLAEQQGLRVLEVLTEAKSAKAPGRPVFQRMMDRLARGHAEGILCWRLDRLARNPVDGGTVIWALKQQGMTIVTPTQTFSHALDNTILMYIEFGMAQKFVDDLSRNVKRGLKMKVEQGWHPGLAPVGYLNDPAGAKGAKRILKDPERFPLVRKMWELLLSSTHGVREICAIVNEQWGFRKRPNRRGYQAPLGLSGLYRIFANPFYAGEFEYPIGSGRWYKGAHDAMVTKAEFDRAQALLGRPGRPRSQRHSFPFTGMIRCGGCGAMVTAEEKWKRQKNGNVHHYVYYRCTKRKRPRCPEPPIERKTLERFIKDCLLRLAISARLHAWAMKRLDGAFEEDRKKRGAIYANVKQTLGGITAQLTELIRMRASRLIEDDEFERERARLQLHRKRLETPDETLDREAETVLSETKGVFELAHCGYTRFEEGDDFTKKAILDKIGSNLVLRGRKLELELKKPYRLLVERTKPYRAKSESFEPPKIRMETPILDPLRLSFLTWSGIVEDVRTCVKEEIGKR